MSKALYILVTLVILNSFTYAQDDLEGLYDVYNELEYAPFNLSPTRNFTICLTSNTKICLYATPTN